MNSNGMMYTSVPNISGRTNGTISNPTAPAFPPPTNIAPSNLIVKNRTQIDHVAIYTPEYTTVGSTCQCLNCKPEDIPAPCANGDWQFGKVSCCDGLCPSANLCSKIDPTVCPTINGNRQISWSKTRGSPIVDCSYSLIDFTTLSSVGEYVDSWGRDADFNDKVMPFFCSRSNTSCPTGVNNSTCSNMLSSGQEGEFCRTWARNNKTQADRSMTSYCTTSGDTVECSCINRTSNPEYQANVSKQIGMAPASCWYKPCMVTNGTVYIPSTLVAPTSCPSNTCSLEKTTSPLISCTNGSASAINTNSVPIVTGTNHWMAWIVGGIIIVLIIILVLFLIYYFWRNSKAKP